MGAASVSAPERAAPLRDASTGSWSWTCQVSPSRPSQTPSREAALLNVWVTPSTSRTTRGPDVSTSRDGLAPGSEGTGPHASAASSRSPAWPNVSEAVPPAPVRSPTRTGSWPGTRKWWKVSAGVPPSRQPLGTENGSTQSAAGAGGGCRSSAAAAYTSSGTPSGTRPSASRSTRPVSSSPAATAGWASSRRRNPALVGTPSTTVSARAARSRRSAVGRSGPYAMTFESIGSYVLPTGTPSLRPESVRAPPPCGSCSASTVPPDGRNPRAGSSAQTRASTACPVSVMSAWAYGRRSPEATRSCHSTRSSPVTSSVTGCSTWRRVFISMNQYEAGASPGTMNSTVPAPTYPHDLAACTAASPIAARVRSSSRTDGASSMIFWWRRWSEHSRSPRCTTLPCPSAMTWISMCRGRSIHRSTSRVSSPKEARASRRAAAISSASSASSRTSRMPLPPPPAEGFSRTGMPISLAATPSCSSVSPLPEEPGTTGTPAAATVSLARILSPISEIASAGGPMKTRPASAQARAKPAFSARKP